MFVVANPCTISDFVRHYNPASTDVITACPREMEGVDFKACSS